MFARSVQFAAQPGALSASYVGPLGVFRLPRSNVGAREVISNLGHPGLTSDVHIRGHSQQKDLGHIRHILFGTLGRLKVPSSMRQGSLGRVQAA